MHRLSVLGQLDLRGPEDLEVGAVLSQPKRLALLVYLAEARPHRLHRRDALLALFWPEQPEARARNALRQALHHLRQSLGPEVLVARSGEMVGVDPARLWCDAAAFEDALDRGLLAEALALYGGDLLPGFSIPGSAAFNEWLDDARSRLRHRAARAAWAQAEQLERAGLLGDAAESARRGVALALDDEISIRQLVALLDRVGEGASALRAYEQHATWLQRELDVQPAAETVRLAEQIRARMCDPSSTAVAGDAPSHIMASGERPRVVVVPFDNLTGAPEHDFIGRLVASSVAQELSATRLVQVTPARPLGWGPDDYASGSPSDLTVEGSYHRLGDGWRVSALIRDLATGLGVGSISPVSVGRERPWEGTHELTRHIAASIAAHLDPRVASWADAVSEPPSLEAHQSHLVGMEHHLRGDFRAAIPNFLNAANPRDGFTIPLLWAIQASCNLEEYEQAALVLEELVVHRARLTPVEQLGCDYFGVVLDGDRGAAFRTLQRVAELVPDSEVLAQLGRDAMFANRPRFAVQTLERLDPERGWMPAWTPYWRRLTEAYHMLGEHDRESDAARRGRLQHPEAVSTLVYEARAQAARGEVLAVERIAEEALALGSDRFATAGDVLITAARELRAHGHDAEGDVMLHRALDWQHERCADGHATFADRLQLARTQYEAGCLPDTERTLHALRDERPDDVDVIGGLGALAARTGEVAQARAVTALLRARTGRYHYGRHLLWSARISAVLGDTEAALGFLRGAFARGCCYTVDLHADADLTLLAGDARYREMLRPKG